MSGDRAFAHCMRDSGGKMVTSGGWIHRLRDDDSRVSHLRRHQPKATPKPAGKPSRDWSAIHEALRTKLTPERLAELATATGVPSDAWDKLSPGWADAADLRQLRAGGAGWSDNPPAGAWSIPERDGSGRIIGLSLRAVDGRKGAPSGGGRGLVIPSNLRTMPGPVLIVEGASDVAAALALGLPAVGRPSNLGGSEALAMMLEGETVLVVGERDAKPDGRWPGRTGAIAVAKALAARRGESVRWTLPPDGSKDIREYFTAGKGDGPALLKVLEDAAKETKSEKRSQADALVDLARQSYRLGLSSEGEPFAVPMEGAALVRTFRGGSSLRAELAHAYRNTTGKTPSASALADCLMALEGEAGGLEREPLAVRLATEEGQDQAEEKSVAIDMGTADGSAIVIGPGGWAVRAVSPVLFRRTALTGQFPAPQDAKPESLLRLRDLLNVKDDSFALLVAWMVAAFMPHPPHPVLMMGGEQGTGKSTAARLIGGLIDPSPAPLRSEPKDVEGWALAAAGSWVVCLDNVSHIPGWLSDALCKAVTGDAWMRRKLYSDGDLAVVAFKRVVILTSIDAGALRGDLADRLLLVELERIPDENRRTEAELNALYEAQRPVLLGALLSAVAQTMKALPGVRLAKMPRMADFARVLAALDTACPELTGGRALARFMEQRDRIVVDVLESDPVATALRAVMETTPHWSGTATELLARLTPATKPQGWPKSGRVLAGHIKRIAPALRGVGIYHHPPAEGDKSRTHRLEKVGISPPTPPEPPEVGPAAVDNGGWASESVGGSGDMGGDFLASLVGEPVPDYGEADTDEGA